MSEAPARAPPEQALAWILLVLRQACLSLRVLVCVSWCILGSSRVPTRARFAHLSFTGGRALGSSKDGRRGLGYSGRTTRDFFPGANIEDKPGDNMGKDGPPGSQPKKPRRDRPPGFDRE